MILNSKKDPTKLMTMCPFVGCPYIARKKGLYEVSYRDSHKSLSLLLSLSLTDFISNTEPYFTAQTLLVDVM